MKHCLQLFPIQFLFQIHRFQSHSEAPARLPGQLCLQRSGKIMKRVVILSHTGFKNRFIVPESVHTDKGHCEASRKMSFSIWIALSFHRIRA